jgi:hypothetical protein
MLELIFLSVLSSVFGVMTRAYLEKESARFIFYHSLSIGIISGIYSILSGPIAPLPFTIWQYVATFIFFFMSGYVLSDIIESITFIISRRRR